MAAFESNKQNTKTGVMRAVRSILKDARHYQILYLSTFLVYGIFELSWEIPLLQIALVVGCAVSTQMIWTAITKGKWNSWKSAVITALGLCLILKSTSLWTLAIAAVVAISSKFILRIKKKHLFNPANFGIIFAIVIFQDAWISPGQWGSDALFLFVLSVMGGIILFKIGRLETSLVFLGSLFLMEYFRTVVYQGWEMDVLFHKFSSGTLLLFAFFMITDPMTIPNSRKSRVIWSLILAGATFVLTNYIQIYTAPIWILFFMTPITVLLDKVFPSVKFEWYQSKTSRTLSGVDRVNEAKPVIN